jgi:hypothetical protein
MSTITLSGAGRTFETFELISVPHFSVEILHCSCINKLKQQEGSEEKGLVCDTLQRFALAGHAQGEVHC